jgi:hypothetical protein
LVGIDQPDVDDTPDAGREVVDGAVLADRAADVVRDARERAARHGEYRAAVEAKYREHRAAVESKSGAGHESWDADAPQLRRAWADHETRWPLPKRSEAPPPPDNPDSQDSLDAPGAWRGDGGRRLTPEANAEVDRGCERIREVGENVIVPAMSGIEAEDPDRQLVGFEYRFKGTDRIKEKVADAITYKGRTPDEALGNLKDAVRLTFVYSEERYVQGVRADCGRLRDSGFEPFDRTNSWREDEYKGINSRWREPESGLLFEVQFHTDLSFEAKQLTHAAYERLRNPATSDVEREELQEFQRLVTAKIPVPHAATEIEDYSSEKRDG